MSTFNLELVINPSIRKVVAMLAEASEQFTKDCKVDFLIDEFIRLVGQNRDMEAPFYCIVGGIVQGFGGEIERTMQEIKRLGILVKTSFSRGRGCWASVTISKELLR